MILARHEPRLAATVAGKVKRCPAMAVVALLAACALEQPRGVVRVTYECDQGYSFVARYERDDQVIIELGDREWVLPQVSAIAGLRYDDGIRQLRLNGRSATLHGTDETFSNCVARDWQAPGSGADPA